MGKFRDVAEQILRENGGGTMHIKDITKTAIEKKYVTTKGKTPHASFSSSITEDIKKNKTKSVFERVNSGMYKIKSSKVVKSNEETPSSTINDTKDEENQKNDDSKKEVKKNDETKKDDPNRR
eukprot:gene10277-2696_t